MTPYSSARTAVNLTKGDRSQTQSSCCKIPRAHQLLSILADEKENKTNNLTQFSPIVDWNDRKGHKQSIVEKLRIPL